MSEINLWADDNKPETEFSGHVWRVSLPPEKRAEIRTREIPWVYVEVEPYGMISISDYSRWFDKQFGKMSFEERREVYDWLSEWDLISLRRIGPDDHEYFATKRLDPDWGLD